MDARVAPRGPTESINLPVGAYIEKQDRDLNISGFFDRAKPQWDRMWDTTLIPEDYRTI